jgi:hypothetical protein
MINHGEINIDLMFETLDLTNVIIKVLDAICIDEKLTGGRQQLQKYRDFTFDLKRLIAFHGRSIRLDDEPNDPRLVSELQKLNRLIRENEMHKIFEFIRNQHEKVKELYWQMASSENSEMVELTDKHTQIFAQLGD